MFVSNSQSVVALYNFLNYRFFKPQIYAFQRSLKLQIAAFFLNFARLLFITNFSQIVDSFIAHFLNHQIAVWFQLENFWNASVSDDRYALPDDAIFNSNTNSCTAFFAQWFL